tara:strand:+ start:468 stop:701 length:234 start_codon:yes stop_codon:yes gene_type:complete
MKIIDIANKTNFQSPEEIEKALKEMKDVSDYDLHQHLVMKETLNSTSADTRNKIALAQAEKDRRDTERASILAKKPR